MGGGWENLVGKSCWLAGPPPRTPCSCRSPRQRRYARVGLTQREVPEVGHGREAAQVLRPLGTDVIAPQVQRQALEPRGGAEAAEVEGAIRPDVVGRAGPRRHILPGPSQWTHTQRERQWIHTPILPPLAGRDLKAARVQF